MASTDSENLSSATNMSSTAQYPQSVNDNFSEKVFCHPQKLLRCPSGLFAMEFRYPLENIISDKSLETMTHTKKEKHAKTTQKIRDEIFLE